MARGMRVAPPSGAPAAAPAPAPAPAPAAAPRPTSEKVTFAADAFFDFDKSVLKAEGKAKLDDLVGKVKGINLEVVIAVGHTDSVGADAYNQKLSVKRAETVKAYLVSRRTREIGIRRALGARKTDITLQFLIETAVLSATGGVLGVAIGMLLPSLLQSLA